MTFKALSLNILVILACLQLKAEDRSQSVKTAFDVNDVSFLIPHVGRQSNPDISIFNSKQPHLNLISENLFAQVLQFENPNMELSNLPYMDIYFVSQISKWKLTSIRYNPCDDILDYHDPLAKNIYLIKQTSGCQPKLRVVAQPFDSRNFPLSTALHLLYKLNVPQSNMMLSGLEKIKLISRSLYNIDTNKIPLMIHPALLQEISFSLEDQRVGTELKNLIFQVLRSGSTPIEKLDVITMTIRKNVDNWDLVGGVVRNGKWQIATTNFNLAFHGNKSNQVTPLGVEKFGCNPNGICNSFPDQSEHNKIIKNVLTYNFSGIENSQKMNLTELQILAETIDQPTKTNFFTTNCTSCHISSNIRNKETLLSSLDTPPGITPFTTGRYLTNRPNNLINFGYDGTLPRISTRTSAESALVASRINQAMKLPNPNSPIENISVFWTCLLSHLDWKECYSNQKSTTKENL